MNILPKARTKDIVEQNLKQETLIYDLITNQAFNLNETSSIIYKACDGKTTFNDLKRRYKFSDDFIYLALDELKQNDLLAKDAVYHSPFAKTSRREVIKKVGSASMFVLPLIAGLVAPKAAHAASNTADGGGGGGVVEGVGYGGYCNESAGGQQLICDHYSTSPYLTCRGNVCCNYGSSGNLPAGSSLPYNAVVGSSPDASCQQNAQNLCCSGDIYGSCTNTPVVDFETGEPIVDEFGNEFYTIECNAGDCTCG